MRNFVIVAGPALIAGVSIGFAAVPARVLAAPPDPQSEAASVERLFRSFVTLSSPGRAVALVKDGRIAYRRGNGMADLDHDVKITPTTVFHVGSIFKQFTGAAGMRPGAAPSKKPGEEFTAVTPPTIRGKTMLVGEVRPANCLPGDTCTMRLVPDPEDFEGIPDLAVRRVSVPEHKDKRGHAVLEGEVVDTNRGKRIPADGPVPYQVPVTGAPLLFEVAIATQPTEKTVVTIEQSVPPAEAKNITEQATMAPIMPDSGVCVVHGDYSGDGIAMRVSVDGTPAALIAADPHEVFFEPSPETLPGEKHVVIKDGDQVSTFNMWEPEVAIAANQKTLATGGSTNFRVTLSALKGIPADAWAAGGTSELSAANKGGSAVMKPPGESGTILLTIKNDSPDTATISEGNVITRVLHREDLAGGTYTYHGTIIARQAGSFELEASVTSYLTDLPAISVTHEEITPLAEATERGCCQYWGPASGNWCADETQAECLGIWKDQQWACNPDGKCDLNVRLGGEKPSQTRTTEELPGEPVGRSAAVLFGVPFGCGTGAIPPGGWPVPPRTRPVGGPGPIPPGARCGAGTFCTAPGARCLFFGKCRDHYDVNTRDCSCECDFW